MRSFPRAAVIIGLGLLAFPGGWVSCKPHSSGPRHFTEIHILPSPLPAPREGDLTWQAPTGWVAVPAAGLRLATYRVPGAAGMPGGECSVTVLAGDGGGWDANVARWAGQLGLALAPEQLRAVAAAQRPERTVSGATITTVDFCDIADPVVQPATMLAAMITRGDHTVFVKLTGPPALLRGQRSLFASFCRSIQ